MGNDDLDKAFVVVGNPGNFGDQIMFNNYLEEVMEDDYRRVDLQKVLKPLDKTVEYIMSEIECQPTCEIRTSVGSKDGWRKTAIEGLQKKVTREEYTEVRRRHRKFCDSGSYSGTLQFEVSSDKWSTEGSVTIKMGYGEPQYLAIQDARELKDYLSFFLSEVDKNDKDLKSIFEEAKRVAENKLETYEETRKNES